MPIIWNLFKKPNTFNHNACTQAKVVYFFDYSCYFHWRSSAIICYLPLFFWGGGQFFTFNRFATIFCDFLLLTDFPLLFAIFHYFCVCSFSTFNRFPAIICYFPLFLFVCWFSTFNRFLAILSYFPLYFFDFPFLPDMPLFIADLPQFFADFPHS